MRVLLALLLTFSQAIAPALHAHVGGEHYGDGAHLHNALQHGHVASTGADIESIEGRVVGIALSLVSRALRIVAPRSGDTDTPPALAVHSTATGIAPTPRTALPAPATQYSIQSHHQAPYLLPLRRGPPHV